MWAGNKQDQRQAWYPRKKVPARLWVSGATIKSTLSDKRGLVAKKGGQVGSVPSPFSVPDFACCLPAFSIFPTDQEPGTGQVLCKWLDHDRWIKGFWQNIFLLAMLLFSNSYIIYHVCWLLNFTKHASSTCISLFENTDCLSLDVCTVVHAH